MARGAIVAGRLERWQAAGLLDASQRAAIEAWEDVHGDEPSASSPWRRRLVLVLGFVGVVLAVGASAIILAEYWGDLATWARLALVALVTGVLIAAGESARRSGVVVRRLASFSWVLAVGGCAWLAGLLLLEVGGTSDRSGAIGVSAVALVVATVLWRRLPDALQLVAVVGAAQAFAVSVVAQHAHADAAAFGPVVWLVGALVCLGAWAGAVRPTSIAWTTGAVSLGVGAVLLGTTLPGLAIPLGLLSAAALLWASVSEREPLLLWLGVLGMLVFVPWALVHFLGIDEVQVGGGGTDIVLVLGALVVGLFVLGWSLREAGRWRHENPDDSDDGGTQ